MSGRDGKGQGSSRVQVAGSRIVGTGMFLPETVLPSAVLERRLKLEAGTLEGFLGVRERRVTPLHQAVSDLAVPAAAQAIAASGLPKSAIGLTILATSTPDHPVPATAPQVAHRLGLAGAAFDLMNTCSGWLYALSTADAHIRAGTTQAALVIGANVLSRRLDWNGDWSTAGLFGDGAGAIVLTAAPESAENSEKGHAEKASQAGRLLSTALAADGAGWERIQVPAGGSRIPLTAEAVAQGQHLLRIERPPGMLRESVSMLAATARTAMARADLATEEVDWFLPHQASTRLVEAAARELGIPPEHTLRNLQRYGNTSAASIPILLHEAATDGTLRSGDNLLMAAVAGGMTSGAAVVRW